ncbi:Aspartokinase [Puccinia graminis f. sp. tritici]|uniref:aspartate kinase n=1 Tax=Puccinia graminis f. sp. tritici TaxID=56615 RepID=A0A5B0LQE5_PUCGR|nr:Aspartokinase [Puccinia graminis f. sp. tritici]KAA1081801.1 Aspartokinase [Puccinia graminis f. sp. tritici]
MNTTTTTDEQRGQRTKRSNPPTTKDHQPAWVVQKYGGTSVGKFLPNVATQILPSTLDAGHRVAIVCSARSGNTKSTGTTNLLLKAALEALENPSIQQSPSQATFSPTTTHSTPNGPNPLILSQILARRGSPTPRLLSRTNSTVNGFTSPNLYPSQNSPGPNLNNLSLDSAHQPLEEHNAPFDKTIEILRADHLKAASELISDENLLSDLQYDITYDCERLRSLLLATQILEEISPKSKDLIIGVGEKLSCRLVTTYLADQGFDAELVCLDNIVEKIEFEAPDGDPDGLYQTAGGQLRQPFYDRLALRLGERLKQCEDRIPVITGFFGVVPGSLLTQVGRGYTDLCASLCAVGLGAAELQVWKEVDGIFTADPRKVPKARLLSVVTPEEAAELTYYGSEVIHPFTMEQVIRASIPIRIKNVMNPVGHGTVIYPNRSIPSSPKLVEITGGSDGINSKAPTAITIKEDIVVLNIHSNQKTISHGFFARIFGTLDKFGIAVDLISTSEVHVSMAIMVNEIYRFKGLDRLVKELKDIGEVSVLNQMAILSLVGRKMKNMVGIAGKMFSGKTQAGACGFQDHTLDNLYEDEKLTGL